MPTDWENFLATTEHRRPGRILFNASFCPDLAQRLRDHIGHADIAGHFKFWREAPLPLRRPEGVPEPDYSRYYAPEKLPEGVRFEDLDLRNHGIATAPVGFYHFHRFISPLRDAQSLREIEDYPIEEHDGWDFSYMKEIADAAHARGQSVAGTVGHIYESAWEIRGYEPFLLDMMERPAWAECLLDKLARSNMAKARAYAAAGADRIHCGDDVANQNAMMFSVPMWRRFMLARWAPIWAEIKRINPKSRIWYHSDGNIAAIVPDLVAAGIDILNPVQPECVDLGVLHKQWKGKLTFHGAIGTQSTMPWGAPADVRARVKEIIGKYGQEGGLIVAPTHLLEPEVSVENVVAFAEACREYGTFE